MAKRVCKKCGHVFDGDIVEYIPKATAATAGAGLGFWIGAKFGIVTGGHGWPATIPATIIGGLMGGLGMVKFAKCPKCDKVFVVR